MNQPRGAEGSIRPTAVFDRDPLPPITRRKAGQISYLEGGRGVPFVLLHGLSTTAPSWLGVARLLSPHFRVIAPDLAGFGQSAAVGFDAYMEDHARALSKLLDDIDVDACFLAAHDFGGPVAVTLMRLFPQLRIHGIVLSNTNLFTDTYVPPPLRTAGVPVLGSLVYRLMAGSRFGLWLTYRVAVARKDELGWAAFSRDVSERDLQATQRVFQRSLADLETNYRPVQRQLASIQAPALVLWGDCDPFFSLEVGRRTADALPQAYFRVLEGAGHFGPQECPGTYAGAIVETFGPLCQNLVSRR